MKAHLLLEYKKENTVTQISRNISIYSDKNLLDSVIIKCLNKNKRRLCHLKRALITSPRGNFIYSIEKSHLKE